MSEPNTTPPTAISAEEKRLNRARLRLAVLKELRALLRKRNETWSLSQRQLADRLGTDEARVSRILNGDENLTLNTVADFFRALEAMPIIKGELFEAIESQAQATTTVKSAETIYSVLLSNMRQLMKDQSNWQVSFEAISNRLPDRKSVERHMVTNDTLLLFLRSPYGASTAHSVVEYPQFDRAGRRPRSRTPSKIVEPVN